MCLTINWNFPTSMVGMGKGHIIQECFQVANVLLEGGNRPYCEDWTHIDIVYGDDEPHATENPPTSPPGIDFPGRHKINILFADNFAMSELVPKNQALPSTPKCETEPKVWVLCNSWQKCLHYGDMYKPVNFSSI